MPRLVSQVFSVHVSYHVPTDNSMLILPFPDILLVTCELLKASIGITWVPQCIVNTCLKEKNTLQNILVAKVDTNAAGGQGFCILNKNFKTVWFFICSITVQVLQEDWTVRESVLGCVSSKYIFKKCLGCRILFEASVIPHTTLLSRNLWR